MSTAVESMNETPEERRGLGLHDRILGIEVTTHCDGSCLHCFVHAMNPNRQSLPVDVVKEILDEGYGEAYRRLHLTGGEPLLWEGLFPALDHAFGAGYEKVTLNTNGLHLSGDMVRRLAGYEGLSI